MILSKKGAIDLIIVCALTMGFPRQFLSYTLEQMKDVGERISRNEILLKGIRTDTPIKKTFTNDFNSFRKV